MAAFILAQWLAADAVAFLPFVKEARGAGSVRGGLCLGVCRSLVCLGHCCLGWSKNWWKPWVCDRWTERSAAFLVWRAAWCFCWP
jgi:hypothetical protein